MPWRQVFGALAGVGGSNDGGKGERNMAGVGRGQIIISRSDDHRGRRHCAEVICSHANRRKRSPSGCSDSLQKTIQPSAQESLEISRSTSCKIRDEGGRCGQSDNCGYKISKLSNLRRTLIKQRVPRTKSSLFWTLVKITTKSKGCLGSAMADKMAHSPPSTGITGACRGADGPRHDS
ncbi:hypothetical protein BC629DRAFT_417908 [Irpex lacteus]|nr:hypothetical protein BC629DRAFT_417908 [Irpex lacteus]